MTFYRNRWNQIVPHFQRQFLISDPLKRFNFLCSRKNILELALYPRSFTLKPFIKFIQACFEGPINKFSFWRLSIKYYRVALAWLLKDWKSIMNVLHLGFQLWIFPEWDILWPPKGLLIVQSSLKLYDGNKNVETNPNDWRQQYWIPERVWLISCIIRVTALLEAT